MMITAFLRKLTDRFRRGSQLEKNILSGTLFSVGNAIIGLLAYPIYLKYLGAEKYGLWTLISVVFEFSQFGQMGTERALMKYVAGEYGKKNFRGITEYVTTSFYILLAPALIIILILALFRSQLADFLKLDDVFKNDAVPLILLVGILSAFSFFVNLIKGVIMGIGRMDLANYHLLLARVLQIILNVILLVMGLGIWSLYYGFMIFYIFPLIMWMVFLKRTYREKILEPAAFNRKKMRELVRFGGALMVGTIAQMLVTPFNKIIIGRYVGLAEVAYYQVALQVVMTVRNLCVKGLEAITPKVSEIYRYGIESFSKVLSVHSKAMRFVFFSAVPLFLFVFFFSEPLLRLWLGGEFNEQIVTALKLLLVGWLVHSLAVPDYFMFLGIGKVGYSVSATCMRSLANVVFIILLLIFNITLTFNKVVLIDSLSLAAEVAFLKYKFFDLKRLNRVVQA